ncbi:MAG: DUF2130 domain-containing protein [Gemmatimonadetes bacterium]|nr:DUF2130 domain-containing protein [Gemmatimonadota bacterium]
MTDVLITCSNCGAQIPLTESLAGPLLEATKKQFEQRLRQKDAEVAEHERVLALREADVTEARLAIDHGVAEKIDLERATIAAREAVRAKALMDVELKAKAQDISDLTERLALLDGKLASAQLAQTELLRKERELDDTRRELDLTIETRVQQSLGEVREQARREAGESLLLRVAEKEQTIVSMQRQIEELKRRAEQGSQQMQGEVQELALESQLRNRFPLDAIEPVPKGEHGGDVIQHVRGPGGLVAGAILWEAKRTKNWSDGWLEKLRDDKRLANAALCVLSSQALPKGVDGFEYLDEVWVTHPRVAMPLAAALRQSLLELAATRKASEGRHTKSDLVYEYLTGSRFRERVRAIVEAFLAMKGDLDREKRAISRQWAKREQQLERVMLATTGLYGDLEGIAGSSLAEIESIGLASIEAATPEDGSE